MLDMSNLIPAGTVDQPLWVSGGSYTVGQQVVSPANFNSYVRKTNGAGVTDPQTDNTNWKPFGMCATKSISGTRRANGLAQYSTLTGLNVAGSGSLTAGVLSTVLSRTNSSGFLHNFYAQTLDATLRDMRLKITIDGIVVFDQTYTSLNAVGYGFLISGSGSDSSNVYMPALTWTNSILIEWSSSLTEAGKFLTQYMYEELQ